MKRAVVLLSGGLDSTTTLALAKAEGRQCFALTVRYGQRHEHELEASKKIAVHFDVAQHLIFDVDLRSIGGSALTSSDVAVPKDQPDPARTDSVPVTYVPARNTLLLSIALGWAEVVEAHEIWIGVSSVDYSGYPDCRPEFIEAFERLAAVATRASVEQGQTIKVRAPLIKLSKAETIQKGLETGVDYGLTHTCYDPSPDGRSCGRCDACQLRLRAFAELGMEDPISYQ